jgi:hypothetical protein
VRKPFPIPYCLNVHDASSWPAVQKALDTHVLAVKRLVAPDRPFPLSLHLGNQALRRMRMEQREAFSRWLAAHDCRVVAFNAFPYGRFQGVNVKTKVYRPNWTDPDRLAYTRLAIAFLSSFLPGGGVGTVTTVPGGWSGEWISPDDDRAAIKNLRTAALFCRELEFVSDRRIRIAIEPEPGCAWKLFDKRLEKLGSEICWCLDTCHAAVEFCSIENLDWSRIGRVQLSAAIECDNTPAARAALIPFVEPRYLHQTRAALGGEIVGAWPDLAPALKELPMLPKNAIVRTHYHIPLTWTGSGPLRSTRDNLTPAFFKQARRTFCEVETYTHSIAPRALRPHSLADAIAAELGWAAERYGFSSSTKRKTVSPGLA